MSLAAFLLQHKDRILVEWDAFASSCQSPGSNLSVPALRDHAEQILDAIAADLQSSQTQEEEYDKSRGLAPLIPNATETAAQTHAVLRAKAGFDINQLVAEYRALRASITRLWNGQQESYPNAFSDFVRFHEAVDQAIAESVEYFDSQLTKSRNLLLGTLGHDLRTPLGAIQSVAHFLAQQSWGAEVKYAGSVLVRSARAMQSLIDDLVDFNRIQLGLGLSIDRARIDLDGYFSDELSILRTAHPDRSILFDRSGETTGYWDGERLQQLLRNLVSNAVKYSFSDSEILVRVNSDESKTDIEVTSHGPAIFSEFLDSVFEPLQRANTEDDNLSSESLGLGLFIVKQVAVAHGGKVNVDSQGTSTVFTICLPRWLDVPNRSCMSAKVH